MIPGLIPESPHSLLDLANQLVGQVVHRAPIDARFGRVVGRPVPAATHDEVQAAGLAEALQPGRVTPDAGQRQVDKGATAGRPEPCQLVEDDRLVARQLPVVPAVRDVPQRDLGVLVRQGEPEVVRRDRAENGLDVGHGPRCYAVGTGSGVIGGAPDRGEQQLDDGGRPALEVGRAIRVAGLDPLEHQAVEQREEAAGDGIDVQRRRQLATDHPRAEEHLAGPGQVPGILAGSWTGSGSVMSRMTRSRSRRQGRRHEWPVRRDIPNTTVPALSLGACG